MSTNSKYTMFKIIMATNIQTVFLNACFSNFESENYKYFGVKPVNCILFPFRAAGDFKRVCDGKHNQNKFYLECILGIAVGYSKFINGMIFLQSNTGLFLYSCL